MIDEHFLDQLERLAVERRPEVCLGCRFGHRCSIHARAVILKLKRMLTDMDDERRKGRWVPAKIVTMDKDGESEFKPNGFLMCSSCQNCYVEDDWLAGSKWKYCPQCGAEMEEDESNGIKP